MKKLGSVITRFAPSPTGFMHMGSVRTALFAYLFARQNGGKFILRIEDTDHERSKKEFDDAILDAMKWLGLEYDEIYRQSERSSVYRKHIEKLLQGGKAFVSKEAVSPDDAKEGKVRRAEVIRFKNPNKTIKFADMIRGDISFDTTELGDFVIARSVNEPVFHLAVAVDDCEMGVTHVIRGEDHISNTPRHILISEALGAPLPTFAHLPLVLAPDRTKLSKRKHGEIVSLEYYRKLGYLPEAILNFMVLIGWNPGTDDEIFGNNQATILEDLITWFDLTKVQKGGAIFNEEKLRWINKKHIEKRGGWADVLKHIPKQLLEGRQSEQQHALAEMFFERISVYGDMQKELDAGELSYFLKKSDYPVELLKWKKSTSDPKSHLEKVILFLKEVPAESFTKDVVKNAVWFYAEKEGRGDVLWPLRVAISGLEKSPDPFTIAAILGKEETLVRIKLAINLLS